MKYDNNKVRFFDITFLFTSIICITPLVFGFIVWNQLPDQLAYHFNLHGEADLFGNKIIGVLIIPSIVFGLNIFMNLLATIAVKKSDRKEKIFIVEKWIIPIVSTLLAASYYLHAFGSKLEIGMLVLAGISFIFILLGICFPGISPESANIPINVEAFNRWKKINGFVYILLGVIDLFCSFFSFGIYSFLISIIVFILITILFVVKVSKRQKPTETKSDYFSAV